MSDIGNWIRSLDILAQRDMPIRCVFIFAIFRSHVSGAFTGQKRDLGEPLSGGHVDPLNLLFRYDAYRIVLLAQVGPRPLGRCAYPLFSNCSGLLTSRR